MGVVFKQAKYRWINPYTFEEVSTQRDGNGNPKLNLEGKIIKAGIQAPPGTHFNITLQGEDKPMDIMIGRTGILEIEYENLNILRIQLVRHKKFKFNKAQSDSYKNLGAREMTEAINEYYKDMGEGVRELQLGFEDSFLNAYIAGYENYRKGVKGVYEESPEYQEITNVLIDYIEEVQ